MFIDSFHAPFSGEFGKFSDNPKYLTKYEPMQRNDFFRVFGEKKIKEMGRLLETEPPIVRITWRGCAATKTSYPQISQIFTDFTTREF